MAFVFRRIVVERVDPEQVLRNFPVDSAIVFPAGFEPHAADRCLALTLDLHMPERRRDRLRGRGAVVQFGQADQHVDEQVFRFAVVRIVIGAHMEVRALNGSLRARDSEQRG